MTDLFGAPDPEVADDPEADTLDLVVDGSRPERIVTCPVCSRVTRIPAVAPSRTTATCSVCLDAGVLPGRLF